MSNLIGMLRAEGLSSGIVYATSIMKVADVRRMVEDFKAQEHIGPTTDRILAENNCKHNEKAAMAGDSSFDDFRKCAIPIIPIVGCTGNGFVGRGESLV